MYEEVPEKKFNSIKNISLNSKNCTFLIEQLNKINIYHKNIF